MRIVAGKFKGMTLLGPKDKKIRPLKDMVRESIFNLLTHSNKILLKLEQSNILDLYAGSGSFGLECLSRKAFTVFFVEKELEAINILSKNINKLNLNNKTQIIQGDVLEAVEKKLILKEKFDLIFCDPPFNFSNIYNLITSILNKKILKKKGIIILHRHKNSLDKYPNHFKIIEERNYGISKIIFGYFLF